MANIRQIRGRIKSVKNIAQITRAMELVAASKMKRAQAAATAGKLYASKIYQMVMELSSRVDVSLSPLLTKPNVPTGKRLVVYITTNKGLCGGLNTTSFRFLAGVYETIKNVSFITVGRKGAHFVSQMGSELVANFSDSTPWTGEVPAIIELVTEGFLSGTYDGVDIVFNEFHSVVKQQPVKKTILPLTMESSGVQKENLSEFLIEPNAKDVFDALLPHYLENQLRDAILQSEASEHSSRMIAMHNATDNALSIASELTLIFNKARQEKITYEISDMVTARLAVE
jgi:F-type H+-transporting ATPase subunit gamma